MSARLSGWCSGHDGCTSPRAHATCGDRIARGLLDGCGCQAWGGHKAAQNKGIGGAQVLGSDARSCENGGTNQDGPRATCDPVASTTGGGRGPRPTLVRSAEL